MQRHARLAGCLLFGISSLFVVSTRSSAGLQGDPRAAVRTTVASQQFSQLPLAFELNRGQVDPQVKYLVHAGSFTAYLTPSGVIVGLHPQAKDVRTQRASTPAPLRVAMQFIGANTEPSVAGLNELAGKANYLIGADPRRWVTDVPTYGRVAYANLYSGIDLLFYGSRQQLEYDFHVRAGADPSRISFSVSGADHVALNQAGDLVMGGPGRDIVERAPHAYQLIDGAQRTVPAQYTLRGDQVSFHLGAYDPARPLVIDPVLSYSTYVGGSGTDIPIYMDLDTHGNVYMTGQTDSIDFPTTPGAFQRANGGTTDVFVSKLNATGSGLLFSTYLGGTGDDAGLGIAAGPEGRVYVVGGTDSTNFPTTRRALQRTYGGGPNDGFVVALNSTGSKLVYSTYLGGSGYDVAYIGPTDQDGQVYAVGFTDSADYPTTRGAFQRTLRAPGLDGFVSKLNPSGSRLMFSTYLGGTGDDLAIDGTVDRSGNTYVTGFTSSTDFPVTRSAFQGTYGGGGADTFVAKLNSKGSALVYATYLGGTGFEAPSDLTVDSSGNAYVPGETDSQDFPTTAGAFQSSFAGGNVDGFLTRLDPTGSRAAYSTYIGGSGDDAAGAVRVDGSGNAVVPGVTDSTDFPTTPGALQSANAGGADAFVIKLNRSGTKLLSSTYLGGTGDDGSNGSGVGLDKSGNAYVVGFTSSADFPTTAGAFQTSFAGAVDVFVAKLGLGDENNDDGQVQRGPSSIRSSVAVRGLFRAGSRLNPRLSYVQ